MHTHSSCFTECFRKHTWSVTGTKECNLAHNSWCNGSCVKLPSQFTYRERPSLPLTLSSYEKSHITQSRRQSSPGMRLKHCLYQHGKVQLSHIAAWSSASKLLSQNVERCNECACCFRFYRRWILLVCCRWAVHVLQPCVPWGHHCNIAMLAGIWTCEIIHAWVLSVNMTACVHQALTSSSSSSRPHRAACSKQICGRIQPNLHTNFLPWSIFFHTTWTLYYL